ncbi:tol-pal system protein YbgF [Marinospirillum celere]|uniref:Cell division coordinator CpoB n=1 Tax=Marinospirillum celere TaxID=1122252 RepID=A0A1I1ESB3_9GAMM|nr:tol-pal system protein YbgF [Marinospirillum celere]SFB90029.1 tol-pal system protein YbgF [Marinospirillum celere]
MKAIYDSQSVRVKTGAIYGPRFILASVLLFLCLMSVQAGADNRNTAVIQAELFMQLEQLQVEVQNLRNKVERQERALSQMQDEQRRRYIDLDERLQDHSKRLGDLESQESKQASERAVDSSAVDRQLSEPLPSSTNNGGSGRLTDREAYAKAYQLVPERKFEEAIKAFQDFIRNYPESRLVGNGYYWIGEIYMAQNRTRDAEKMFEAVVRRYQDSFKIADSKYKLGLIYSRYGNEDQAKEMMQNIINEHPREPAAELARTWLNR